MLKKIDSYVIKLFLPPFIVSFSIALFVLLMQNIWLYMDDIMGKGAGLLIILEFLFYFAIFVVPSALVIGVLLSSVMTLGNLGEHFELSSLKSAGVSLLRVMRPLFLTCTIIGIMSFLCSNVLSPWAKVRYNSRLYDLRRQKPTLSIEEGVFNDSFSGFTMRIGKKDKDNVGVHDVMVYEAKTENGNEKVSEVLAKDGKIYSAGEKQYLVMDLTNGTRYEEASDPKRRFAYIRTSFKSWRKIFDMSELDQGRTDESLFKSGAQAKPISLLYQAADSLNKKMIERNENGVKQIQSNFAIFTDTIKAKNIESLSLTPKPIKAQDSTKQLTDYQRFEQYFKKENRIEILTKSQRIVNNMRDLNVSTISAIDKLRETRVKFVHELHSKFVLGVMCVIFMFVGAPMGAIVRKGGFGVPILIAISFFIIFIFMSLMFRKLAEQGAMNGEVAAWAPAFIMFSVGAYATYKAMKDQGLFENKFFEILGQIFKFIFDFIFKIFKKKKQNVIHS